MPHKPKKPRAFTFEGARFDWYKEGIGTNFFWWLPKVNGEFVPKDVLEAANEAHDAKTWRRILVYWMTGPGDEDPRYWTYMAAGAEQYDLEQLAAADDKRKPYDPAKLSPEWRQALLWRLGHLICVKANTEQGADAYYVGDPPPAPLTVEDLGIKRLEHAQRQLLSVAPVMKDRPKTVAGPVRAREKAEQATLL